MKKHSGSSIHMFTIVFTTVFIAVLLIIFTAITSNINRRNDVDLIARKYLLKMEIQGGLTQELKVELEKELAKHGVININLSGTTEVTESSPTNYGEIIKLCINADMYFITYNKKANSFITQTKITIPLSIIKTSTSKC